MQILQCYSTHEEELLKQMLEAQKEAADPLDKVLQIFDAKVIVSLKFAKLGRELYLSLIHISIPRSRAWRQVPRRNYKRQTGSSP